MGNAEGIVALAAIVMVLYFAYQGGRKNRKPNFDRVPIITGIAIAVVLGIGFIVGAVFF